MPLLLHVVAGMKRPSHAMDRAWQRYGVELSWQSYRRLCADIRTADPSRARLVVRWPGNRSAWLVRHQETTMLAIYEDRPSSYIVTFLPLDTEFYSGITPEIRAKKAA